MAANKTIEELNKIFGLSSDRGRQVPYDMGYCVVLAEVDLGQTTGIMKIRAGENSMKDATQAFVEAGIINKVGEQYQLTAQLKA